MGRSYPIDFVRSFPGITESDIEFGFQHGLIMDNSPARLTHLFPTERMVCDPWTAQLETWRTIALKWTIEQCSDTDQSLFDEIDSIYAEFDYPKDMQSIVSYMPGDDDSNASSLKRKIFDFCRASLEGLANSG